MKRKRLSLMLIAALAFGNGVHAADIARTASVAGKVRVEGPLPKAARINMAADPTCAKLHPGAISSDDFVASADGGLGNVIVFVLDGLGGQAFDVPSQPVVIDQKGCMYEPHIVAMQTNQKLRVVNEDNTLHNIHPLPKNNREWNKAETPGVTFEEAFSREEIAIPVKCNVHPWMHGYIAVFKHPFFAITGKDGSFNLKSLPPGNYTIEAWHEKLGTVTQKVTVAPGETKSIDFVFKSRTGS